ncbi:MAG: DUF4595 domain-containing protein [Muribaculaceae bacterium]|nr:DUF4595 domain-containing protein [Muribaculaceae bacterium]
MKFIKFTYLFLLWGFFCLLGTGCTINDDDLKDTPSQGGGNSEARKLLKNVTYFGTPMLKLEYDTDSRVTKIEDAVAELTIDISYEPVCKILIKEYDNNGLEEVLEFSGIGFNEDGSISGANTHETAYEPNGHIFYEEMGSIRFGYDDNHHLTLINVYNEDGTLDNSSQLVWEDNLLTKTVTDDQTTIYNYDNDALQNVHGQWVAWWFNSLTLTGLIGDAPAYLVSEVRELDENGKLDLITQFRYKFDADSYISTMQYIMDSDFDDMMVFSFNYETVRSDDPTITFHAPMKENRPSFMNLFKRKH